MDLSAASMIGRAVMVACRNELQAGFIFRSKYRDPKLLDRYAVAFKKKCDLIQIEFITLTTDPFGFQFRVDRYHFQIYADGIEFGLRLISDQLHDPKLN